MPARRRCAIIVARPEREPLFQIAQFVALANLLALGLAAALRFERGKPRPTREIETMTTNSGIIHQEIPKGTFFQPKSRRTIEG